MALGRTSAQAITRVAGAAIASSLAVVFVEGGEANLFNGGDLLAVIAQIQFVALLGSLSLPVRKGFRSLSAGVSWAILEASFNWLPRFGDHPKFRSASKGCEAFLAVLGMSAEELLVYDVLYGLLGIVLITCACRAYLRFGRVLPRALRFPALQVAAFWVCSVGFLHSSLIALRFRSVAASFKVVAAAVAILTIGITICVLGLIIDPLLDNKFVPAKVQEFVFSLMRPAKYSVAPGAEERRFKKPPFKLPSRIGFVLSRTDADTTRVPSRWPKTFSQRHLGSWQSSGDDGGYHAWLVASMGPLVFDRMAQAVSYFCVDAVANRVFTVIVLVTVTHGTAQLVVLGASAALRALAVGLYLPFNSNLGNIRELALATSHVVIFATPLVLKCHNSPTPWLLASKIMMVVAVASTQFALLIQLWCSLGVLTRRERRVIVRDPPATNVDTTPHQACELRVVLELVIDVVLDAIADALGNPIATYESVVRPALDQASREAAHVEGLKAVKALYYELDEAKSEADNASAALGQIAAAMTQTVAVEASMNSLLTTVPRSVVEDVVQTLTTFVVNGAFTNALDLLATSDVASLNTHCLMPKREVLVDLLGRGSALRETKLDDAGDKIESTAVLARDPILATLHRNMSWLRTTRSEPRDLTAVSAATLRQQRRRSSWFRLRSEKTHIADAISQELAMDRANDRDILATALPSAEIELRGASRTLVLQGELEAREYQRSPPRPPRGSPAVNIPDTMSVDDLLATILEKTTADST